MSRYAAIVGIYVDPADDLPTAEYRESLDDQLPVEKATVARLLRELADNLDDMSRAMEDIA